MGDLTQNPEYDQQTVKQVAEHLGNYVYLLVDPRDGRPFYVGKGQGLRMLGHRIDAACLPDSSDEAARKQKEIRLRELATLGLRTDIWIVARNLGTTYTAVEAAVIDLFKTFPVSATSTSRLPLLAEGLVNEIRGSGTEGGIQRLDDIIRDFAAPDLDTETPLLLITLKPWEEDQEETPGGETRAGRGFKREWTDPRVMKREMKAVADSTRCWWSGLHREKVEARGVEHLVTVYGGVTRAIFRVQPSTWEWDALNRRGGCQVTSVHREPIFDAVIGEYGHRIPRKKRGDQTTFRYWPFRA